MNFSDLTTLKIGGPIAQVIPVRTEEQFINNVDLARIKKQPYLVIGGGSNLLVSDNGFEGIVIKNEVKGIQKSGLQIIAKSGVALQDLIDYANHFGLGGLENLAGIPGTLGGAVYGNAGAYGQTISDYIVSVKALNPTNGQVLIINKESCLFNYRDSVFKKNKFIVLEATFALTASDANQLKKTSAETIKKREVKYPSGIKCPGSFFKNIPSSILSPEVLSKLPPQFVMYGKVSAGALLEGAGGKGATLGAISIAPYHANLFINKGRGTARDFYQLAKTAQLKVWEKYQIKLEPEVQFVNLPPL